MNEQALPAGRLSARFDAYMESWLQRLAFLRQFAYLVYEVGRGFFTLKGRQREHVYNLAVHQVIFSGIDAVAMVSAVAVIIGGVLMVQMLAYSPGFQTDQFLIGIITGIIVKEIAPIFTALVLVGRSGSAITVELGQMRIKHHDEALAEMGIDIVHYFHLPRVAGLTIAGLLLNVYFVLMTFVAWLAFSSLQSGAEIGKMATLFVDGLDAGDFLVCMLKGGALGMAIAFVCIHQGMNITGSATQIPQRTSKAIVDSFMISFAVNMLISVAWYLLR